MSLAQPFDAGHFRRDAQDVIEVLAGYLARIERGEGAVLPWRDPEEMLGRWPATFPEQPAADGALRSLLERLIAESNHLHHPRYVGHQVTAPLPSAALCDLVSSLLNNGAAVYEMGPVASAMERNLIRWMAGLLGWPAGADGIFTSGGAAGNQTPRLAARQAKAGFDAWTEGNAGGPPLAVLAADQAHYCVQRSVQLMGWGKGGVVPVATDARYRLRADALPGALAAARRAGRRVVAVVGSAMSTATGAFDPLDAIADFCAANDLWFHVDGAHGASAAIAPATRGKLRGIERADSVVWDAHKMLLVPALVTAVLFRDGRRSFQTFAQEASYLFAGTPEAEWWNLGHRTLECTKGMIVLKLYAALATQGTQYFADYFAGTFELAQRFARLIEAAPDFELAVEPEGNIVCFRHRATGDAGQARIRQALLRDGSFYLVQTSLGGRTWLRTTLVNPLTTIEDLRALLAAIRQAAA